MRNGWLAFALLSAACVGAAVRPVVFPAVTAQAPRERCDWRYLSDTGNLDLPEIGESTPMGEEWVAMSSAGYHLAARQDGSLVFERCVPAN